MFNFAKCNADSWDIRYQEKCKQARKNNFKSGLIYFNEICSKKATQAEISSCQNLALFQLASTYSNSFCSPSFIEEVTGQ